MSIEIFHADARWFTQDSQMHVLCKCMLKSDICFNSKCCEQDQEE
jgi:hypothetical protein